MSTSSSSSKQKPKRNVSYEFNYFSNHNGTTAIDFGLTSARQKNTCTSELDNIY